MKIAYLSQSTVPSKEANNIHVMKMCNAFSEHGCKVSLLVPEFHDDDKIKADPFEFYGVKPTFDLLKMCKMPLLHCSISYALQCIKRLFVLNPDLVFSRSLVGSVVAVYAGFPVIFEFHQPVSDYGVTKAWLFKWLISSKNFLGLVVVTKSLKEWYQKHFQLSENSIFVAPDGADIMSSFDNSLVDLVLPEVFGSKWHVGYIGGLYPGKGMEIIIPLAKRCPDVNFHIVGGRESDITCWKLKTGILKNVFFHGFYPHARVIQFMKKMDVLLVPNLRSVRCNDGNTDIGKWTSPLKLFEYMAAKKPILASDIEVLREVLVHEKNSVLCDPDDNEAWQAGLRRLLSDQELADRLTSKAFADLTEKYTWSKRAETLLDFIKSRL